MAPTARFEAIEQRLGWLDAPEDSARQIADLDIFVSSVRRDGFTDVVLLGMGGSSLAAEVLRDVPAPRAAGVRLTVLDTTDESAIRDVSGRLAPERTAFCGREQERIDNRSLLARTAFLVPPVVAPRRRRAPSSSPSPIPRPRSSSSPRDEDIGGRS